MDIKTVILAIPFSIVARYLATKAGAQIIARASLARNPSGGTP